MVRCTTRSTNYILCSSDHMCTATARNGMSGAAKTTQHTRTTWLAACTCWTPRNVGVHHGRLHE